MKNLFNIYIVIHIILCLHITELNGKTIGSNHSKDNIKSSNNNPMIYDNQIKYYLSEPLLSNQITLEETIREATEIEYTTPYAISVVNWLTHEKLLENYLVKAKTENEKNSCIMDNIKTALIWWSYENGTLRENNLSIKIKQKQLDLSYRNISSDEELLASSGFITKKSGILVFSASFNNLTAVPYFTLETIGSDLQYLTLKGNRFLNLPQDLAEHMLNYSLNDKEINFTSQTQHDMRMYTKPLEGITWATFPHLASLLELDISNCNIEFVNKNAFQNLSNLKSLYMSYNKMLTIPSDAFYYLPNLQILDMSFINVYDSFKKQLIASPTLETVLKLSYGVNIQQKAFKHLPNLVYLDFSHTKLTRSSAVAFTLIGPNLKYLSLCYTSFPMFGNGLFKNTSLIGLDISGNTQAALGITEDVFEDMPDSLIYLYFERSNLKDLAWLKHLSHLRFLALAGNNINTLSFEHFRNLKKLQALDLTSNQVGNWYTQVFNYNENLRILSLRDNNINIITSEMLKDFSSLVYLSLGNNNFICNCLLRDLVDIAAINNRRAICKENFWQDFKDIIHLFLNSSIQTLDIPAIMWLLNIQKFRKTVKDVRKSYSAKAKPKLRFILEAFNSFNKTKLCANTSSFSYTPVGFDERLRGSLLQLQLLDYEEEHYWCYNETERQNLLMLNCQRTLLSENIAQELNYLTTYVWGGLGGLIIVIVLGTVIYWKRWHIYYYYSSIKTATLLSAVSQEQVNKFNSLYADNPHMIYDIFISYCLSDRDWIVEELMPNVEESGDISICLHERDFQIGVTILDNIVSCMERSRALMLIISSNFLLSHWCQFEMHMAQYHIFDLNRDHLILVFLEDIPRSKRPKNLQYLMDVKTYIKWPGGKNKKSIHAEERKLFWKRLKRTFRNIGLNPIDSKV